MARKRNRDKSRRAIKLLPRHAGQAHVWATSRRFNALACGRRWGKTHFGLDLLIDHPSKGLLAGMPCAWSAPTYSILTEVWREACAVLDPIISRKDTQQHRLELYGGGVLDCWSLDGDNPMRGRKYGLVVLDEAAFVRNLGDKWNKAIRPTLADMRGEAWFLSSPAGLGDFYDLFKRGQHGTPEARHSWMSWQMPTSSNPFIDPDEIEEARHDTPPLEFRQEWLGEFVEDGGQVFDWSKLIIGQAPHIERVWIGVDPAASTELTAEQRKKGRRQPDQSAIAVVGQDQNGTFWLLDLRYGRWNASELNSQILRCADQWKPIRIWIEGGPIGLGTIDWLKRTMNDRKGAFWRVEKVSHMGDKLGKARDMSAANHARRFGVPADATWLADFRDEFVRFNGIEGNPDDLVDAAAIVFRKINQLFADRAKVPAPKPSPERSLAALRGPKPLAPEPHKQPVKGLRRRSALKRAKK